MADVYFLVGQGNTGKSTTVRALTGVWSKGSIALEIGSPRQVIDTWVEVRSLQENNISPQQAVQCFKASGCPVAIIALRELAAGNQPDAQAYVQEFQTSGHSIAGIATIGTRWQPANIAIQPVQLPLQAPGTAPNQRAAALRSAWSIT